MSWSFDRCAIIASVVTLCCRALANLAAAGLAVGCCEVGVRCRQPDANAVRATTPSTAGTALDLCTIAPNVRRGGSGVPAQTYSALKGANGMLRTTNQARANASVTAADHRWCCQLRIRRPETRP